MAISVQHALLAGHLAGAHRDPFDRILIAQAIEGGLTLCSNEDVFDQFGVRKLW